MKYTVVTITSPRSTRIYRLMAWLPCVGVSQLRDQPAKTYQYLQSPKGTSQSKQITTAVRLFDRNEADGSKIQTGANDATGLEQRNMTQRTQQVGRTEQITMVKTKRRVEQVETAQVAKQSKGRK